MARPAHIRDDTILDAARAVFLERGAQGTTGEVAARAGVSEGTIFNRFKTKEALFRASMHPRKLMPEGLGDLAARVGVGDARAQLAEIAAQYLEFFTKLVPFLLMEAGNPMMAAPRLPDGTHPATRQIRAVMGYLEAEMRLGRVRRHDPEIVARVFLGAIFQHAFLDTMTFVKEHLPLPGETFLRGLVAVLWSGLEPQRPADRGIERSEPKRRQRPR